MTLMLLFKKCPVATLPDLEESLGVSARSVLRRLKEVGYYTSYTHNSRFYTLASLPRFDRNLIWVYEGIGFTKLATLYDLIVHCVDRSPMGYCAGELGDVVHTRVANQLGVLSRGGRLRRARFTEGHVYFSLDHERFHRQVSVRRQRWTEAAPMEPEQALRSARLPGGLSHDEIVMVLLDMIRDPRASVATLGVRLQGRGVRISESSLLELVEAYQLDRYKKRRT